jgi:hypothetical protein
MIEKLEARFDEAMHQIYRSALSECRYRATRFLQLVETHGGLSAAKQLLHSPGHPEGLTKLWELGRLDLSMEALVLTAPWDALFTDDDRRIARKRLRDLGWVR